MTSFALVDATTWIGGYDMTGDLNQMALQATSQPLDNTVFGLGGYRRRIGGLKNVAANFAGFDDADDSGVNAQTFTNLGVSDRVVTLAPDDAEASTAYMFQGGQFRANQFGQIGQMSAMGLSYMGTNGVGLVRGQVAKAKGDVSATGATGTVLSLGDVASGEYLYATLHVFSAGTTITVEVESDDDNGFPSATSRGSFTGITAVGGTWMTRVAGPITDTFWRFNVTAVTGTFSIAGAIGIG